METTHHVTPGITLLNRDTRNEPAPSRATSGKPGKAERIVYYVSTGLLAVLTLPGGVANFLRAPSSAEVFDALGYPAYFGTMLGAAKLLGVFAILAPVPRVLREWAYAGFVFDVIAAAISVAVMSSFAGAIVPIVALVIVLVSYRGWRVRLHAARAACHGTA